MTSCPRVLIVGGGKMGEAILAGWLSSSADCVKSLSPSDFLIVNPGLERRKYLNETYGVNCVADVSQVELLAPFGEQGQVGDTTDTTDKNALSAHGSSDDSALGASGKQLIAPLVILAVKPQILPELLPLMAQLPVFQGGKKGPLFVSIAAGVTTQTLSNLLPDGAPVVRVMPNMPLQVLCGASAVCAGKSSNTLHLRCICELFDCLGSAVIVEEDKMDAVCALSGSGPAYVAALIEALTAAAIQEGLDEQLASSLALQTVLGTAKLIDSTGISAQEARASICSPGGTTLAALDAMYAAGFNELFAKGVHAAVVRSKELGNN